MKPNPYLIEGPALISFSGGRTSAYMLHEILRAHGGALPADVHVTFANTGKEREETLRFVHECAVRWGVRVHWLEWRDSDAGFDEVGFNSASRAGEPFASLIRKKKRLPNWQERWCTSFLKLKPMFSFAESLGLVAGQYLEVIGLRDDEGMRILTGMENAERDGRRVGYPLARAKVVKAAVMSFWQSMPFDLGLEPWEGNCDFCFLKGRGIKKRLIREGRASPAWWIAQEAEFGFFDRRDLVVELVDECRAAPDLFDPPSDFEYDAECGTNCEVQA